MLEFADYELDNRRLFDKTWGQRIVNLRYRLWPHWTQGMLAERMGINQSALSDIENGKRQCTLREFLLICETLELSPRSALADD